MFFHLFFNSNYILSDDNDINSKLIKVIMYGSVLYIITHGFINTSFKDTIFKYYYWIILLLDLMSIGFIYIVNNNGNTIFNMSQNQEPIEIKKITENNLQPLPLPLHHQQQPLP